MKKNRNFPTRLFSIAYFSKRIYILIRHVYDYLFTRAKCVIQSWCCWLPTTFVFSFLKIKKCLEWKCFKNGFKRGCLKINQISNLSPVKSSRPSWQVIRWTKTQTVSVQFLFKFISWRLFLVSSIFLVSPDHVIEITFSKTTITFLYVDEYTDEHFCGHNVLFSKI